MDPWSVSDTAFTTVVSASYGVGSGGLLWPMGAVASVMRLSFASVPAIRLRQHHQRPLLCSHCRRNERRHPGRPSPQRAERNHKAAPGLPAPLTWHRADWKGGVDGKSVSVSHEVGCRLLIKTKH